MTDLIQRLRGVGHDYDFHDNALIYEAADALEKHQNEATAWEVTVDNLKAEIETLKAQAAKDAADAGRYRWLREASGATPCYAPTATLQNGAGWEVRYEIFGDRFKPCFTYRQLDLDSAIDTAMKESQQ